MLPDFDLNLLAIFDAVMAEGSVTRAAKRLDMNPPAVSQSIRRLRVLIGDELFVRTGNGVKPTPKAQGMWEDVRQGLKLIKAAVDGDREFDPATATQVIHIDLPSGADALIVPRLADRIAAAPGLQVRVASARAFNVLNDLRFGDSWLALDYRPIQEPGYRCDQLAEQEIVVIARKGHPALRGGLTSELYQTLPQVAVASLRTTSVLPVTERLEAAGATRVVKFTVPGLVSASHVVAEHGLLASLPRCTAELCCTLADLEIHPMPIRVDKMRFFAVWHERFLADPAHTWLRQTLHEICGAL